MSNFRTAGDSSENRRLTTEELEKQFEGLTLALFNSGNGLLGKHLGQKKVLLAFEGARHFRPPRGLGQMPYEGCALAIFADPLGNTAEAFMKDASTAAKRIEEVEGEKVAVFQEKYEEDIWTTYVAFPQNDLVVVATSKRFLGEVLLRTRGGSGERALPDTLPEWKFVDKRAKFWGLRHFDRSQANQDPTSPFQGKKTANLVDEQAIGLTYQFDPQKEKKATLTYLSGDKAGIRRIEEARYPSSSEPTATAGLHIQYRELDPGVIQTTYDLSYAQPFEWFLFVLMANLGRAIYL